MSKLNPFIFSAICVVCILTTIFGCLSLNSVQNSTGFVIFLVYFFVATIWTSVLGAFIYFIYEKKKGKEDLKNVFD